MYRTRTNRHCCCYYSLHHSFCFFCRFHSHWKVFYIRSHFTTSESVYRGTCVCLEGGGKLENKTPQVHARISWRITWMRVLIPIRWPTVNKKQTHDGIRHGTNNAGREENKRPSTRCLPRAAAGACVPQGRRRPGDVQRLAPTSPRYTREAAVVWRNAVSVWAFERNKTRGDYRGGGMGLEKA